MSSFCIITIPQLLNDLQRNPAHPSIQPWHKGQLESALLLATSKGYWQVMLLLIKAGAHNFKDCIEACHQSNHVSAFLHICHAAQANDQQMACTLIESYEGDSLTESCSEKLIILHHVLVPLLQNGKLSLSIPIRLAIHAGHKSLAGYLLQHTSKHPRTGIVYYL